MSDDELSKLRKKANVGDREAAERLFHKQLQHRGVDGAVIFLTDKLVRLSRFVFSLAEKDENHNPIAEYCKTVTWLDRCRLFDTAPGKPSAMNLTIEWPPVRLVAQGPPGPSGPPGPCGQDGKDGKDGKDGTGVVNVAGDFGSGQLKRISFGSGLTVEQNDDGDVTISVQWPCAQPGCPDDGYYTCGGDENPTRMFGCGSKFCEDHAKHCPVVHSIDRFCRGCLNRRHTLSESGVSLPSC